VPDQPNGGSIAWRIKNLETWKAEIDKLEPPVMAFELKALRDDVRSLRRAFYTFAFSTVGAAIIFAFSVFALLGKNP
jgi:hypothetical protein